MTDNVWESRYFDAYDKILLNSEIYLTVRDFHVNAMRGSHVVLDSGCGTGNVTAELLKKDHTVYTVDSSEKALDILRKKCTQYIERLHVYNLYAEHLPFEDEMFDGISSMFVVYYIDDWENYLKENYRVLKPNGVFVLTGRATTENRERVLESYRQSLIRKGLMDKLKKEWKIFSDKWLGNVMPSVKNRPYEKMVSVLEDIGFKDITQYPNPYFGQCYSLTAKKHKTN